MQTVYFICFKILMLCFVSKYGRIFVALKKQLCVELQLNIKKFLWHRLYANLHQNIKFYKCKSENKYHTQHIYNKFVSIRVRRGVNVMHID